MIDQRPIDVFKIPPYYFRSVPSEQEVTDRIAGLTASASHPTLKAIREAEADGKHELIDGIINWTAMKRMGVQIAKVEWHDYAVEDRPFQLIQHNHSKRISHHEVRLMLPVLEEYYDRNLNGAGIMRKTKFIEQQLRSIGFHHLSQNNVEPFKQMCSHANWSRFMDRLDSRARQFTSTYSLWKELNGEATVEAPAPPAMNDGEGETDNSTNSVSNNTCAPMNSGPIVPIRVIVNGNEFECNTSQLCSHCMVHQFVMQGLTNLPPVNGEGATT